MVAAMIVMMMMMMMLMMMIMMMYFSTVDLRTRQPRAEFWLKPRMANRSSVRL